MAERKAGRPTKETSEKRNKQVMLSFTEAEYEHLQKMKTLFNQATLTATVLMFMEKGMEAVQSEFVMQR